MKNIFLTTLLLLSVLQVSADEVQLTSNNINIQMYSSSSKLVGIDEADFKKWQEKIKRFGNHNGDLNVLLDAQKEIARLAPNKGIFGSPNFDFNVHIEKVLKRNDSLSKQIANSINQISSQIIPLREEVERFEKKERDNEVAIKQAEANFQSLKLQFKQAFMPSNEKHKKKFLKGLESDKFFKTEKVKNAASDNCVEALFSDAGDSKSKVKNLKESIIGNGISTEKYLYCPMVEFSWLKSKEQIAFVSSLSEEQKKIAFLAATNYLPTTSKRLARVHTDVTEKAVKKEYAKDKRELSELNNKLVRLENEKNRFESADASSIALTEQRNLAEYVNKSMIGLAELTFSELIKSSKGIPSDGYLNFDRDDDFYFVVFKSGMLPAAYALIREEVKTVSIDNSMNVVGLLSL